MALNLSRIACGRWPADPAPIAARALERTSSPQAHEPD